MATKNDNALDVQYPLRMPRWLNEAAEKLADKRDLTRAQLLRGILIREIEIEESGVFVTDDPLGDLIKYQAMIKSATAELGRTIDERDKLERKLKKLARKEGE